MKRAGAVSPVPLSVESKETGPPVRAKARRALKREL